MSTADDRLILTEYADWESEQPVLAERGIEEFLDQRENRFNTSRIADALALLNDRIGRNENRDDVLDHNDAMVLLGNLAQVRDVLEGDRPFVETTSIIGPTTREYF